MTPIDPTLVVSKALTLTQGTIAAGGNRYEANLVAKYMFKTGQGSTAYDTSGVTPAADLSLSGNVSWVGGWGINIGAGGKAQASTSTSAKLAAMIQSSGEFTLETWVAPANVTQTNAFIVSYSGSNTTRDATLGQAAMQYQGATRSSATDTNGMPPLVTTTTGGAAQAALQHVVLTYDPVNGQKIYVNGVYTGDADPAKGGTLANWDSTFALVLGNETTGQRQCQGVIKFVAIHNRALTAGADPAELRGRRRPEVLPAVRRERAVGCAAVVHPFPGEPVRQLQLSVLPAEIHQPQLQGGRAGEPADQRYPHRRERCARPGGAVVRHHGGERRRGELQPPPTASCCRASAR